MKYQLFVFVFVAVALTGCVSIPADFGRSDVDELTRQHGLDISRPSQQQSNAFIEQPLNVDSAVALALINNPEVARHQATLMHGSASQTIDSGVSNPMLSAGRLELNGPGGVQRTLGLAMSLSDIVTLPARKRLAEMDFLALKKEVANDFLHLANQTIDAFFSYAATCQLTAVQQQDTRAARLVAQLAGRFYAAGNIDQYELEQAKIAAGNAELALLDAQIFEASARKNLSIVLGVSSGDEWKIEPALPALPSADPKLSVLLNEANDSRLDRAIAALQLKRSQRVLRSGWSAWLQDAEIGYDRETEIDDGVLRGPSLAIPLPLFNLGRSQAVANKAQLQLAEANLRGIDIQIDNEVRQAHLELVKARQRVEIYEQTLLPAHALSVERMQEQYNFMLQGVFDLFETRRQQFEASQAYLESIRDYWLAMTSLTVATGNKIAVEATGRSIDLRESLQPGPDMHQFHDMSDHKMTEPEKTDSPSHQHHGS